MTEVATYQHTGLAIASEQVTFTEDQRRVLAHMGVENAPEADLRVFMHVCQRSGLDPFARQIHMIGRNSKNPRTQQWETKYTIQTGIDGYRLIGRRAANATGDKISIQQPEWAHEDGTWRPVWSSAWGLPVAARVTITRSGEPFTAVALFDEYKQTKKDGGLTSMWAQRPAGQLAKCAEALAWRMAFPQDLSGIYTDDEMGQADNHHTAEPQRPAVAKPSASDFNPAADAGGAVAMNDADDVHDAEVVEEPETGEAITKAQRSKMFALFSEAGFNTDARTPEGRAARLDYIERIIDTRVESTNELTVAQASQVIEALVVDAEAAGQEAQS